MIYTGVTLDTIQTVPTLKTVQIQRTGIATSTNLNTWTQQDTWIFSHNNVSWAGQDTTQYSGQQFRDPFVMPDPNAPGHWLMYYVTVANAISPNMVVGVARSTGNLSAWADSLPLMNTGASYTNASIIESPHVFPDSSRWWLFMTPGPYGPPKYNPVSFQTNTSSFVDPVPTHWTPLDTLYNYLDEDPQTLFWHASEYLKFGQKEFLAAWADSIPGDSLVGIVVRAMNWTTSPDSFKLGCPSLTAVPLVQGVRGGEGRTRLVLTRLCLGQASVELRAEVPAPMPVRVVVYDVAGRRRRTLVNGTLPAGTTKLAWDGRDANGVAINDGVYFVRLTSPRGSGSAKVVLLR